MNVNFETIEKAWFKPKKNALDEFEKLLEEDIEYLHETKQHNLAGVLEGILDKIQELKKEMK